MAAVLPHSASQGQDEAKRRAARHALRYVEAGMVIGLGTGSTATHFVDALGEAVAQGLDVVGVPTSERTAEQARRLDIPLSTLDSHPVLDLTVDGADEFDPHLRLIKGGGGALLREKIIAAASRRMIVVADSSKAVAILGRFPLPVEVNRFGLGATRLAVAEAARQAGCAGDLVLRQRDGQEVVTDGGHLILDCHFGRIADADDLAALLANVPGVVEHGLFLGLATLVVSAAPDGAVTILSHPAAR